MKMEDEPRNINTDQIFVSAENTAENGHQQIKNPHLLQLKPSTVLFPTTEELTLKNQHQSVDYTCSQPSNQLPHTNSRDESNQYTDFRTTFEQLETNLLAPQVTPGISFSQVIRYVSSTEQTENPEKFNNLKVEDSECFISAPPLESPKSNCSDSEPSSSIIYPSVHSKANLIPSSSDIVQDNLSKVWNSEQSENMFQDNLHSSTEQTANFTSQNAGDDLVTETLVTIHEIDQNVEASQPFESTISESYMKDNLNPNHQIQKSADKNSEDNDEEYTLILSHKSLTANSSSDDILIENTIKIENDSQLPNLVDMCPSNNESDNMEALVADNQPEINIPRVNAHRSSSDSSSSLCRSLSTVQSEDKHEVKESKKNSDNDIETAIMKESGVFSPEYISPQYEIIEKGHVDSIDLDQSSACDKSDTDNSEVEYIVTQGSNELDSNINLIDSNEDQPIKYLLCVEEDEDQAKPSDSYRLLAVSDDNTVKGNLVLDAQTANFFMNFSQNSPEIIIETVDSFSSSRRSSEVMDSVSTPNNSFNKSLDDHGDIVEDQPDSESVEGTTQSERLVEKKTDQSEMNHVQSVNQDINNSISSAKEVADENNIGKVSVGMETEEVQQQIAEKGADPASEARGDELSTLQPLILNEQLSIRFGNASVDTSKNHPIIEAGTKQLEECTNLDNEQDVDVNYDNADMELELSENVDRTNVEKITQQKPRGRPRKNQYIVVPKKNPTQSENQNLDETIESDDSEIEFNVNKNQYDRKYFGKKIKQETPNEDMFALNSELRTIMELDEENSETQLEDEQEKEPKKRPRGRPRKSKQQPTHQSKNNHLSSKSNQKPDRKRSIQQLQVNPETFKKAVLNKLKEEKPDESSDEECSYDSEPKVSAGDVLKSWLLKEANKPKRLRSRVINTHTLEKSVDSDEIMDTEIQEKQNNKEDMLVDEMHSVLNVNSTSADSNLHKSTDTIPRKSQSKIKNTVLDEGVLIINDEILPDMMPIRGIQTKSTKDKNGDEKTSIHNPEVENVDLNAPPIKRIKRMIRSKLSLTHDENSLKKVPSAVSDNAPLKEKLPNQDKEKSLTPNVEKKVFAIPQKRRMSSASTREHDEDSDTESRKEWMPEDYAEYKHRYNMNKIKKPSIFKCKICLNVYTTYYMLQKHKKDHEKEKPYHCKTCEDAFGDIEEYRAHLRAHSGKAPYQCRRCGEGFNTKAELTDHHQIHILKKEECRPKRFSCEFCEKEFRKLSDLERHLRVHTGEKPCVCSICNKGFQQMHNLSKHLLLHLGLRPFTCEICTKTFNRIDVLNRHLLTHSVEKPFKCDNCSKGFIRQKQLQQHMKKVHPDEQAVL